MRKSAKLFNRISDVCVYGILITLGILWVLPICYLVYTAFRVTPSTGIINTLFPEDLKLGFGNFTRLFSDTMFGRWLANTILVSVSSCVLTTIFILMVSYALSRLRFRFRSRCRWRARRWYYSDNNSKERSDSGCCPMNRYGCTPRP